MSAVLQLLKLLIADNRRAMLRALGLSVAVLVMGAALLGLSGWFITATGLAGLAGVGIAFDVFRPSAGVRFLALGRAAARYGERLLSHDATLRALAALRVVLLKGYATRNARELSALRSETALTRIVADVDALDGLILRLVLPVAAAIGTHVLVFGMLIWLIGAEVAIIVCLGYVVGAALILWRLARASLAPSARGEEVVQALRRALIDMMRDRQALILSGQLSAKEARLHQLDREARETAAQLDTEERRAAFFLSVLSAIVAVGALVAAAALLDARQIEPAPAVIGFFVALALMEAVIPLRRGFADLGRMIGSATRIAPLLESRLPSGAAVAANGASEHTSLEVRCRGVDLVLRPGEGAVLTGPSGAGKTTLLMEIAGLGEADESAAIALNGRDVCDWPEGALRERMVVLPQRSALMAGSIRDNLSLATDADDDVMWDVLRAVALADEIRARGGLETRLGEGGAGLSGGQARRLCIARILLKECDIVLLDEPTEGLDAANADAVLNGIRAYRPEAMILAAMHRGADHEIFGQRLNLDRS